MSTTGFRNLAENLGNFAINATDFGNVYVGTINNAAQMKKFFTLQNVKLTALLINTDTSTTFYSGSGVLTFNDGNGFSPSTRGLLTGIGNGGWSILDGLHGSISGDTGGSMNFSVELAYNNSTSYALLTTINFQTSSVPCVVTNLPLSYQPGYSVVGTQGGFLGQTVRVLSNGAFNFSLSLTVDDTIANAYYQPSDFTALPADPYLG